MTCPRYGQLYLRLEAAGQAAMVKSTRPGNYPPFIEILQRARAHREICEECNADFDRAFPEVSGRLVTVSLIKDKEFA